MAPIYLNVFAHASHNPWRGLQTRANTHLSLAFMGYCTGISAGLACLFTVLRYQWEEE
jgi:hypothetical protein